MRILVIGSGGREHALVWKLAQSPQAEVVLAAPGNGGTALDGHGNRPVAADDVAGLVRLAQQERIDLVVPGPELPLTLGVTDAMKDAGIACFGPDAYAAQLEGSKAFAKEVMQAAGVPTAKCAVCTTLADAEAQVKAMGAPLVVKADGLAAGKGVIIAMTGDEALAAVRDIMQARSLGDAGSRVLLEEYLEGEEVSLLCLCDGTHAVPLPSAQDHKRAFDNDEGPNTGGMGAYSPAPIVQDDALEALADATVRPILRHMAAKGHPFVGVLYAGLMMTANGPKVLEYNVRFGDPECQPLLMRLQGDLAQIMLDCVHGTLDPASLGYTAQTALGVVVAAKGYPGSYPKGMPITGIEAAERAGQVKVFHSGTKAEGGQILSSGGRVLCVTALGGTLAAAQQAAYAAVDAIVMPDSFHRHDIGAKGIARLNK